jgi:dTMP kinase
MQSPNRPYDGLFVSLEGGDGCGKTTLAAYLVEQLQQKGYTVFKTREPGGTPLSEQIRHLLLNPQGGYSVSSHAELLLYLAARAQNYEERIRPALHRGEIVICERFHDSSIAYQGGARHLGMEYVEKLCQLVCPHPDFTLFLDVDPEEGIRRVKAERKASFDRLEQEKLQFHREVRQGYLHLVDAYPERIALVDASLPLNDVKQAAWAALAPHLMLRR